MTAALPLMGLGTFGRTGPVGLEAILAAIGIGYRHIDTAQTYDTERNVGEAIVRSGRPRSEFTVTTKVDFKNFPREAFRTSLLRSLEKLRVDAVDLTLLHWPSPADEVPLEVYVEELARAKSDGLTRMIGVSNFTVPLLERTIEILGPGQVATNQVELHPFLQNKRLAGWCARQGILITAYVPLAKGRVALDATLQEIARRHSVNASQVALAWAMQLGIAVIPASSSLERMKSNYDAQFIRLTQDEMEQIRRLECNQRIIDPTQAPQWDSELED